MRKREGRKTNVVFGNRQPFTLTGTSLLEVPAICNTEDQGSIPGPGQGLIPQVGKIAWRREWQSTPVFLPGKSPWTEEPGGLQSMGHKELEPT